MQDNRGLKGILSISSFYAHFQNLVGARHVRAWLATNYWKVNSGDKVVDIGCGPGTTLDDLPDNITYIGIDISEEYVRSAKQRFDPRATFIVGTARELVESPDPILSNSDLILCTGLLHHLDDEEVMYVFKLAKQILNATGRLICLEPTYLVHQGYFSKWSMRRDRGRNVRTESEWKKLASSVFKCFTTNIATNLYRLPYIHIIIECRKETNCDT